MTAFSIALLQLSSREVELSVFVFSTGNKTSSSSADDSQARDLAHSRCSKKCLVLRLFAALTLWLKDGLSSFPSVFRTETKKDSVLSNSHFEMKSISSCSGLNLPIIVHAGK